MRTLTIPPRKTIASRNSTFQELSALKTNRKKRNETRSFLVEGVAPISIAIKYRWKILAFVYAKDRELSRWASDLLRSSPAGVHYEVTPPLLTELSDKEETSELLAVIEIPKQSMADLPARENGVIAVFDRPSSPGNLGSSLRSADAFGVDGVVITGHAVDRYDPHVVRGSMGALFALPALLTPSHKEIVEWVASQRSKGIEYQIVGTSANGTVLIDECDLTKPTVLIFGNETVGMSAGYSESCDIIARIPIGGALSSLNVSCAATTCLYELQRQRRNIRS